MVKPELQFGMARMFSMLTDDGPLQAQVFRNASEALTWLDEGLDLA